MNSIEHFHIPDVSAMKQSTWNRGPRLGEQQAFFHDIHLQCAKIYDLVYDQARSTILELFHHETSPKNR